MSKRVSSREDVFVSTADMLTVLLCCFLGLAFLAKHGDQEEDSIELPVIADIRKPSARTKDSTPVVFLSWNAEADVQGVHGARCKALARFGDIREKGEALDVPCWPRAFDGEPAELNARLQGEAERGVRAIIYCPRKESTLESCARLHWIAAEHGFSTAAAISTK